MRPTRLKYLNSVLCLALAFPAIVYAKKLYVDHDQDCDFTTLRTYAWRTHPVMEADPALAQRAIAGDIVMSEGNQILMGRGYQPDDISPDFYITYFVKGKNVQEAITVGSSGYYGYGAAWVTSETHIRNSVDGTLVIDIVDAKTDRLVWRATYRDNVSNWKKRHKVITKAVHGSLKKFPPKPGK